ncbi:hypothetical protein [Glutamicibacter sp.]|uniref:hypothetical protein n=1 Tax=Glutamicibacter sp. TaxID=1931995 RepID=UPI0028BEC07B|nr:hypothetical protein [Glutamicibacter sp.]
MNKHEHPETIELIHHVFTSRTKAWGEYAWSTLVAAGKVPADLDDPEAQDYVDHVITMAALAALAEWFEDDYDLSDFEPSCEILEPKFTVSPFEFGRYVEINGIDPYDDGRPNAHHAAKEAVLERTRTVARDLRNVLGYSKLFTSLWSIAYDESISLPPTEDDLDRTLNLEVDSEKGYRFERLQEL